MKREKEKWLPIKNSDSYFVSNWGNFKVVDRLLFHSRLGKQLRKGRTLSQRCICGYLRVCINSKEYISSRVVALHFCKNKNPKHFDEVNHLDHNKLNNYYKNLEWTNRSGNIKHDFKMGVRNLQGESSHNTSLTNKQIKKIRKLYVPRKYSTYRLGREFNVHQMTISRIINKKTWQNV